MQSMICKESKKDNILCAGLGVMKTKGYNGTGVKDIVEAAGIPKGSFYNYFESKEAFAVEILEMVATKNIEEMKTQLLIANLNPLDALDKFFSQMIENAENGKFCGGCFIGNLCQEMSDSSEDIRKEGKKALLGHIDIIEELINRALDQKLINQNLHASSTAEFLFNAWEGSLLMMKTDKSRKPLDTFTHNMHYLLKL